MYRFSYRSRFFSCLDDSTVSPSELSRHLSRPTSGVTHAITAAIVHELLDWNLLIMLYAILNIQYSLLHSICTKCCPFYMLHNSHGRKRSFTCTRSSALTKLIIVRVFLLLPPAYEDSCMHSIFHCSSGIKVTRCFLTMIWIMYHTEWAILRADIVRRWVPNV